MISRNSMKVMFEAKEVDLKICQKVKFLASHITNAGKNFPTDG